MKKNIHIIIGDIHGRNNWKTIVKNNPNADKYIFIGDYFDSFDISSVLQLHNFKEILKFKTENSERVILLCGNHDYHYLSGIPIGTVYSGYQMGMVWDYANILNPLIRQEVLQVAFEFNGYLITHAGVSKTWCNNVGIDVNNVVEDVNTLFIYKLKDFGKCGVNMYGDSIDEGPFWIRPKSLRKDKIDNYQQIVGHTACNEILTIDNVTVIDTLEYDKYLILQTINGNTSMIIGNI
jgi:hypothetical protein